MSPAESIARDPYWKPSTSVGLMKTSQCLQWFLVKESSLIWMGSFSYPHQTTTPAPCRRACKKISLMLVRCVCLCVCVVLFVLDCAKIDKSVKLNLNPYQSIAKKDIYIYIIRCAMVIKKPSCLNASALPRLSHSVNHSLSQNTLCKSVLYNNQKIWQDMVWCFFTKTNFICNTKPAEFSLANWYVNGFQFHPKSFRM